MIVKKYKQPAADVGVQTEMEPEPSPDGSIASDDDFDEMTAPVTQATMISRWNDNCFVGDNVRMKYGEAGEEGQVTWDNYGDREDDAAAPSVCSFCSSSIVSYTHKPRVYTNLRVSLACRDVNDGEG